MCAGSDCFPLWSAVVVGLACGPAFVLTKRRLINIGGRIRIDDPLDAVPVHGVGGVIGLTSVYFFQ